MGHLLEQNGAMPLATGVSPKGAPEEPATAVRWLPGSSTLVSSGDDGAVAEGAVGHVDRGGGDQRGVVERGHA